MSSYEAAHYSRDNPPYLAPYGLRTAPFSSTHDDRFLYLDAERQQLLTMLQQLIRHSHLLLLVVGEWGSGKSSLKQRFINGADEASLMCEISAQPKMDADELLSSVAQGFGLIDIPTSSAELQNKLYRYLAGLQHYNVAPTLIVDDAHELPQDALEALFYLSDAEASQGNLLRTILFCEPSINVVLDSDAIQPLKARVTHRVEIPPFDAEQTAEYLEHRLTVAGLEGSNPFSLQDIKRIHRVSGGIPERINEAAHLLLAGIDAEDLSDFEDEFGAETAVSHRLNFKHLALGGIAVLMIAVVLLWEDGDRLSSEPGPPVEILNPGPPIAASSNTPGRPSPPEKTIELEVAGPTEPPVETQPEPEVVTGEMPAKPGKTESVPLLRITGIEPTSVPAGHEQQTLILKGEGFDKTTRITLEWGNQRMTLPEDHVTFVNPSRLEFRVTVDTRPDTWLVMARNPQTDAKDMTQFIVKPVSPTPPAKKKAAAAASGETPANLQDTAWLKRQPVDNFTLQLLASQQSENLSSFAKQHGLSGKAVIFESRNKGRPWFALAYGSYPSRRAAERAGRELPAGIKPWIRQFASIQQGLAKETRSPSKTDPAPPALHGELRDHAAWLWAQDPSRYTLQLLAGRNEAAVKTFITRHNLEGRAVFYRTKRDGNPWYVVVLGSYADRGRAVAGIEQLSAGVRMQSPWPRAFRDVHADLSRR